MQPTPIKPLVLVADDSPDMRLLIKDLLEEVGYEVVTVASGAQALSEMTARPPALLISDLLMPGMTGFSLRALMLRRPALAGIPVIILSAYWHRPSDTLDVAAVITKPLNIDRLVDTVERLAPLAPSTAELQPIPVRPSAPEPAESDGGPRAPRPSQAEGARGDAPVR
ncbi:MAG TPA: response regulator [Candidatus Limnocylindria bacterium]|nr:response regulator [Candidatus Limnocylindria bacterium]